MKKIILASGSAQRQAYFRMIFNDNFEVCKSNYHEDNNLDLPPKRLALQHALGKARDVAGRSNSGFVMGADTFVYLDGKVIGKPKDAQEAKEILKQQSGRIMEVYSGIVIIDIENKKEYTDTSITKLRFAKLSDEEIVEYVKTGEWIGKAGGWTLLGKGGMFIEKIDGCFSNVAGLPLNTFFNLLKKAGIDPLAS